ncbi:MAG: hypothetical protein NTY40_06805 [Synechococcus sp. LacPavin_0920_WC12_MAG_50_7]|nr:hypothetical protein [Synechococcus sp. LacPavin_0920_WC12_MAG_50_7]
MASPQAYEQPTINKAWEDFIAHIPTMLLIWIASVAVGVLGFLASLAISVTAAWLSGNSSDAALPSLFGIAGQFPFLIISSLLGVLFVAVPALYYNSGEVITINAAFSALLQRPLNFVGIEILAWLLVALVSICTCGLGALVAVPVSSFYLQNAAYHKGLII